MPLTEAQREERNQAAQEERDARLGITSDAERQAYRQMLMPKVKSNAPDRLKKDINFSAIAQRTGLSEGRVREVHRNVRIGASGLRTPQGLIAYGLDKSKSDIRFSDLTSSEMDLIYAQVLGRRPTDVERENQQSNFVHEFLYGAREELKAREDRGAKLRLHYLNQWDKAQKAAPLGRTFLEMASLTASMVLPGWGRVAATAATNVGFGAYDESQGREADWKQIATDTAFDAVVTYAASGFDASNRADGYVGQSPGKGTAMALRGGASALSSYARTGDVGVAAGSGVIAAGTTDAPVFATIAGQAGVDLLSGVDPNRAGRNALWSSIATIAPVTEGGTDMGQRAVSLRYIATGNVAGMFQAGAQTLVSGLREDKPAPTRAGERFRGQASRTWTPRASTQRPRQVAPVLPEQPAPRPRAVVRPAPPAPTALQAIGSGGGSAIIRRGYN